MCQYAYFQNSEWYVKLNACDKCWQETNDKSIRPVHMYSHLTKSSLAAVCLILMG